MNSENPNRVEFKANKPTVETVVVTDEGVVRTELDVDLFIESLLNRGEE